MVAPGTILAVYLKHLGAGEFVIALVPTVQMVSFGLTQLPATAWTRRLRRKVAASSVLFGLACLWWLLTGVVGRSLAVSRPALMVAVVLGFNACAQFIMGAASPLWSDVTARLYPDRRRGLASGILWTVLGAFGILGALYARHVLATVDAPHSFNHLFIVGGLVAGLGCQFLWLAKEYSPPAAADAEHPRGYVALIRERWRGNRRLRRLVAARWLHDAGAPVGIFFAVHAIERFGLPDSAAGTFTVMISGAGMIGGLMLGLLGDRRGYRRVVGYGMILLVAATVSALLLKSPAAYLLVFLLQGMAQTGLFMGTMNLLIESTEDRADCATPMALFSTLMLPVWLGAPIMMGMLAERLSVPHAFVVGAVFQLAGLIALVCLVDDPRRPGRRIVTWPAPRTRSVPRILW